RVHWTGYLQENRVSTWLKTADIMVLPYKDGVSTRRGRLMAALAHGRPIVSTQAEIINPLLKDDENMLLVQSGNIEAMKNKVEQIANNADLKERLSQAAQKTSDSFAWPEIADKTIAYFQSVLRDG
ncbi:MAG: glycosyltransferase, partial [Chloroflexota bacterium]